MTEVPTMDEVLRDAPKNWGKWGEEDEAGGAAVVINPMNKGRELKYLLADSGASALLCLDDLYEAVAKEVIATGETAVRTVITCSPLDGQSRNDERLFAGVQRLRPEGTLDLEEIFSQNDGRQPAPVDPASDAVAVLCYTSGTTGQGIAARVTAGSMAGQDFGHLDQEILKIAEGGLCRLEED